MCNVWGKQLVMYIGSAIGIGFFSNNGYVISENGKYDIGTPLFTLHQILECVYKLVKHQKGILWIFQLPIINTYIYWLIPITDPITNSVTKLLLKAHIITQ